MAARHGRRTRSRARRPDPSPTGRPGSVTIADEHGIAPSQAPRRRLRRSSAPEMPLGNGPRASEATDADDRDPPVGRVLDHGPVRAVVIFEGHHELASIGRPARPGHVITTGDVGHRGDRTGGDVHQLQLRGQRVADLIQPGEGDGPPVGGPCRSVHDDAGEMQSTSTRGFAPSGSAIQMSDEPSTPARNASRPSGAQSGWAGPGTGPSGTISERCDPSAWTREMPPVW